MHLRKSELAGIGAALAGFGANPAVLMHLGVLLAFLAAGAACLHAGLDGGAEHIHI
jgi:hypothetical protein